MHKLGVSKDWSIVDVYDLKPNLLPRISKPVATVISAYPLSKQISKLRSYYYIYLRSRITICANILYDLGQR